MNIYWRLAGQQITKVQQSTQEEITQQPLSFIFLYLAVPDTFLNTEMQLQDSSSPCMCCSLCTFAEHSKYANKCITKGYKNRIVACPVNIWISWRGKERLSVDTSFTSNHKIWLDMQFSGGARVENQVEVCIFICIEDKILFYWPTQNSDNRFLAWN